MAGFTRFYDRCFSTVKGICFASPSGVMQTTPKARRAARASGEDFRVGRVTSGENIFDRLESSVRSYCRSFPAVFTRAQGSFIYDEADRAYLDFLSGAGALNYGHNHPRLKRALLEYLSADGVVQGLDLHTRAKREFLEDFERTILRPRGLEYRVQFPGPTGTNAVECALKLARKVTGRKDVIAFSNSFHGVTLGALAVTSDARRRAGAGVPLDHAHFTPFDGASGAGVDTLAALEEACDRLAIEDRSPAAVIVETIQGEGGVWVACEGWLRGLAEVCRRRGMLLIVDDVQMGCGRTGTFFSFERAGVAPDLVCMSKSLSGYGLPLAITLIRPDLDRWLPGEHNGTFRGNNPAFVTAREALRFWDSDALEQEILRKEILVRDFLEAMLPALLRLRPAVRGRGLIFGFECGLPGAAASVSRRAFERGLIIETCGPEAGTLKLLPSLLIDDVSLKEGLETLSSCLAEQALAS
jgi:diaminobutyrate-2-oxoglutarate transaminase